LLAAHCDGCGQPLRLALFSVSLSKRDFVLFLAADEMAMRSRDAPGYGSVELEMPEGQQPRRPTRQALSLGKLALTVLGGIGAVALIVSITGAAHTPRVHPQQQLSMPLKDATDNCNVPELAPDRVHLEGSHPRHVEGACCR
jgi:hypothetical protein